MISITAVGDIMMGTTYPFSALPANDGKYLFEPAKQWLESSDIHFGNFEGTFFDGPTQADGKPPGNNRYIFKTPTRMVSVIQDAGFNVVSLSNNHVKDFGIEGIKSTKATLKKAGIQFSSKAGEVAHFQFGETNVSLIAVDFYKAPRSMTQTEDTFNEIRELKTMNHIVIISAHVGREGAGAEIIHPGPEVYLGENRGDSIRFATDAINTGADVIVMHGPHVPRGIELYKNRLIIYSLGNFVTGKGISLDGLSNIAPLIRFEINSRGEFQSGQIVPFVQKRDPERIEIDTERQAIDLIKKLSLKQFPESKLVFQNNGQFK